MEWLHVGNRRHDMLRVADSSARRLDDKTGKYVVNNKGRARYSAAVDCTERHVYLEESDMAGREADEEVGVPKKKKCVEQLKNLTLMLNPEHRSTSSESHVNPKSSSNFSFP